MSEKYFHDLGDATLYTGDCLDVLETLPDQSVQTCITSPPYFGLRDYGVDGQIGLEPTPDEFVARLVEVFREVRRVLRDDGTLWLNLGDSYAANQTNNGGYSDKSTLVGFSRPDTKGRQANETGARRKLNHGLKSKDLIGIPWRVAFALQADGWYLRQDIIWHKPNPMPESVRDRCTKSHEYIFLLSKSARYYFDSEAIKEPCVSGPSDIRKMQERRERIGGKHKNLDDKFCRASMHTNMGRKRSVGSPDGRNKRSVWTVTTKPFKGAHFATFPPDLIEPCVLAGALGGGVVLDPFSGSGTTGQVALQHGRKYIGIELNSEYQKLAIRRIEGV